METTKHYPILCKYEKCPDLPALVVARCSTCDSPLCPVCGYKDSTCLSGRQVSALYCNECYKEND